MKKLLPFLIVLLLSIPLFLSACISEEDAPIDCIRLHIRANSNDFADQSVKLAVRDDIIALLTPKLAKASDTADALKIIASESGALQKTATARLTNEGFLYGARVRISTEYFPAKSYGDTLFPAGEYKAVIVELGNGTGDNWWCVAFPPLCFLEDGKAPVKYKSILQEILKNRN